MANTTKSLNPLLVSIVRLVLALEPWFICFIMLLSTEAFLKLYQRAGYGWTGKVDFYLWKLLEIAAVGFMVLRWKRVLRQLYNGKFMLAFLAIVWISQYWSIAPNATKEYAIQVIESTILAVYVATRYNFKEQTRLFTIMFSIASVFSILYVFAMPSLGIMSGPGVSADLQGTWRGIYSHKNILGRVMTVAGMFLLLKPLTEQKNRWLAWVIFLICFQLILGANSKTALVGFLFVVAISPVARVFRWNIAVGIPLYISILLLGGTGAVFLGDNWDAALGSLDKDPELNGRVPIWEILIERIGERPWLGYGYHGFWQGWNGKYSAPIWRQIVWKPPHAHNGFIDLMVDVGIVGTLVFSLVFFDAILKSINRSRYTPSIQGLWPLGFMTFYVIQNQTNTDLIVPYSLSWFIFVVICFTPVEPPVEDSKLKPRGEPLGWEPKLIGSSSRLKSRGGYSSRI